MTHPPDNIKTAASERPGVNRLARGLQALLDAQEHRPRTAAEACVLKGLEAMLGVRKLRQIAPRKPTLASVAKQAQKAAIAVARYEVKPDGTVVVVAGTPEPTEASNPWLADLPRETKQ
jgi:hypothetical protein